MEPEHSLNDLVAVRRQKLQSLRDKGVEPFGGRFDVSGTVVEILARFAEGNAERAAGRITAHRDMGKSHFLDLTDATGRIQIFLHAKEIGPEQFEIFKLLDLGDFIGVEGETFTTKTGEPSIRVKSFTMLSKALRPMPDKWHGVADVEIKYRQRYLDLLANPDSRAIFLKRIAIVREIREFLQARGFLEVETPMMQTIAGGAAAQPFKTFHNALGCEFYLRIALELYHKRLLVGGIDKLFEIGKNFRNEGLSRRHNPEFTMLEAYCAFGDYATMMETVESLITTVAQKVLGTLVIKHEKSKASFVALLKQFQSDISECVGGISKQSWIVEAKPALNDLQEVHKWLEETVKEAETQSIEPLAQSTFKNLVEQQQRKCHWLWEKHDFTHKPSCAIEAAKFFDKLDERYRNFESHLKSFSEPRVIDLTPKWRRVKYKDLIREKCGDWFECSSSERRFIARDLFVEIGEEFEDFEVTNALFSKLIEPTLIQPTFVTHLPKELVPLAKLSPDDPTTVEVFECCINGQEISPGYTEQNDPIAQRATLEHQAGGEQQKLDEDFLIALEHGMPPAGGIGIGIDRLCMMLLGQESIRDVILFPQLKPK